MTAPFAIYIDKNRTVSEDIVLYQEDGGGLTLNVSDRVRFKVYRRDAATPILDIDTIGTLTGGSIITVTQTASAAMATLKICQVDIASIDPGAYSCEIDVVDSGDSDLIKSAGRGVLVVFGSGGGDIGTT